MKFEYDMQKVEVMSVVVENGFTSKHRSKTIG